MGQETTGDDILIELLRRSAGTSQAADRMEKMLSAIREAASLIEMNEDDASLQALLILEQF